MTAAQELHTSQGCAVAPLEPPGENGDLEQFWRCPFIMPEKEGQHGLVAMFHRAGQFGGHAAVVLDGSWFNLYYNGKLNDYNPAVNITLGCVAEFGDWDNLVSVPTGDIPLTYDPNGGEWTQDFSCPDDPPILMVFWVDSRVTW